MKIYTILIYIYVWHRIFYYFDQVIYLYKIYKFLNPLPSYIQLKWVLLSPLNHHIIFGVSSSALLVYTNARIAHMLSSKGLHTTSDIYVYNSCLHIMRANVIHDGVVYMSTEILAIIECIFIVEHCMVCTQGLTI